MRYLHPYIFCFCVANIICQTGLQAQNLINPRVFESLEITPANEINTPHLEFSPSYYKDGIIYIASGEKQEQFDKHIDESFFEIKLAEVNQPDKELILFLNEINQKDIHRGPGVFTQHDSVFYYTIEKRTNSSDKQSVLEIACIEKLNKQWIPCQFPLVLPEQFSYCHPSVNSDHNMIVFASDMPGGYGGMDLYISFKTEVGWTEALNFGPEINSSSDEVFPYLFDATTLFFSAERPDGLGGLDIYAADLVTRGIQLLEAPFNSPGDDFGFIIDENSYSGYFSSNRSGPQAKDDIYKFHSEIPLLMAKQQHMLIRKLINLWVRDSDNGFPLPEVLVNVHEIWFEENDLKIDGFTVDLVNKPGIGGELLMSLKEGEPPETRTNYTSDSLGLMQIELNDASRNLIVFQKSGYATYYLIINPGNENYPSDIFLKSENTVQAFSNLKKTPLIAVEKIIHLPLLDERKGEIVVLDQISYENNRAEIIIGASTQLDALANQLLNNEKLVIELSVHTDSRGDSNYNLSLSEARAQTVKAYLVQQNISPARIQAKGFGERFILNHCVDGIACSESEHKVNRRTEVKVISN